MNQTVTQHALIVVALVLTLLASALVMLDPLSVNGQAIRRWNPRRVPANTVFLGDQVCLDCHKKFASFDHSGMAMAMVCFCWWERAALKAGWFGSRKTGGGATSGEVARARCP